MGFINWKFKTRGEDRLTPLAQRIADRSRIEVSRRLVGLSPDMSQAEARGYIRTRAAVVVHREVNLVMQRERSLRPSERPKLIELSTELLVDGFLTVGAETAQRRFAA
ncbi:MAG: hypothetical protein JJ992_22240 [Planctomycetes bacterium]|nr:hypothetical protein [Planctomycetota bacterium]